MIDVVNLQEVYARPDVRRALATGDWATTLRAIFDSGVTQTEVANRTGISQAQISRLARGLSRDPRIGTVLALCDGLGIPRSYAGLTETTMEETQGRRSFLAGALAMAGSPVLNPRGQIGDETLLTLTTLSYRRLEQDAPSRMLVAPVLSHLHSVRQLAKRKGTSQHGRFLAAMSEVAGLAGWLHADLADAGQARRFYRIAISAAAQAGQPLLWAYMPASLGQFASGAGDPVNGLRLIREAGAKLPRSAPASRGRGCARWKASRSPPWVTALVLPGLTGGATR